MDVKLPNLGEGADSGSVVSIFVKVGDQIAAGATILELENEKAVAPIPSPAAGKVTAIHVKEGDKVTVGQSLVSVEAEGAPAAAPGPAPAADAPAEPKPSTAAPGPAAPAAAPPAKPGATPAPGAPPAAPTDGATVASPSVRRVARELGI